MILKDIFSKKIERNINPAVVVGNLSDDTIKTEIDEYVFTNDIIDKVYQALSAIKNTDKVDKTGIWINGYYGSGKSHFIKFFHFCINSKTSDQAFNRFIDAVKTYDPFKAGNNEEITENNVKLLQKWYNQNKIEDILFNVEDETDDGSGERLTRIFLSMFNRFRGYNSEDIPLAILFEKYLDEKGVLDEFKKRLLKEFEHDWNTNAANIASYELSTILNLAKKLVPDMDITSLHNKLSNQETYRITLNHLSKELNEYLVGKDDNYRMVFLVDEVSQYIGKDESLLLNLQEIVSNLSDKCHKKVWVACTAQQVLEDVASDTGITKNDEKFGKILGRFETRISLDSTDPSYITQKRVLDKNSDGLKAVTKLYNSQKDAIENQFKIQHELYKGFLSQSDFELSYPFVPYQFKLIAHVFDAFQNKQYVIKEVKDNERSVLGITHFTAKKNAHKEVGTFIPFDAFFNEQFNTNLTQRGRRAIQNAFEFPYVRNDEFAARVVKVLFMVSNLSDAIRVTFPSNIDNLIVLMMTDADENKLKLKNKIEEVLEKLREGNIIREEKGSYFFYNEDEMDVTSMIKNTTPSVMLSMN
ncbi:MAG: BREX system P-loop protein BrxC [Bacteroidota bacterium]